MSILILIAPVILCVVGVVIYLFVSKGDEKSGVKKTSKEISPPTIKTSEPKNIPLRIKKSVAQQPSSPSSSRSRSSPTQINQPTKDPLDSDEELLKKFFNDKFINDVIKKYEPLNADANENEIKIYNDLLQILRSIDSDKNNQMTGGRLFDMFNIFKSEDKNKTDRNQFFEEIQKLTKYLTEYLNKNRNRLDIEKLKKVVTDLQSLKNFNMQPPTPAPAPAPAPAASATKTKAAEEAEKAAEARKAEARKAEARKAVIAAETAAEKAEAKAAEEAQAAQAAQEAQAAQAAQEAEEARKAVAAEEAQSKETYALYHPIGKPKDAADRILLHTRCSVPENLYHSNQNSA